MVTWLLTYNLNDGHTSTLTPMHLRKAKLMFFYVRYPSSAILKVYFPDVKFNKNNTAQLVKWFSNFRWVCLRSLLLDASLRYYVGKIQRRLQAQYGGKNKVWGTKANL